MRNALRCRYTAFSHKGNVEVPRKHTGGRLSRSDETLTLPSDRETDGARRPRVLLVSLIGNTDNISVKCLHAALRAAGHDSTVLFQTSADSALADDVARFIRDRQFDIVGISFMSSFLSKATDLTRAIRRTCEPGVLVLWGGVHPTIAPESCRSGPDYICVGEADLAMVDFADAWTDGRVDTEVAGFNRPDAESFTSCPINDDLDALPFPEHFPRDAYITDRDCVRKMDLRRFRRHSRYRGTYMSVSTSRGCPYECNYCCNHLLSKVNGRRIRKRSPENVVAEIRRNIERSGVRFNFIYLVDDCFTVHSIDWLRRFVEAYRDIGVPITFHAIPDFVTEDKAQLLKAIPTGGALLGLQTGSERINREVYNRHASRDKLVECAQRLHRHSIPSSFDVIVDNPYETREDWARTIDLVGSLPNSAFVLFLSLTFYKNTRLYEKGKADGLDVDAHANKSQTVFNPRSRQVRLIRLAALLGKRIPLKLLHDDTWRGKAAISILTVLAHAVLEPIRFLRMAWMSQQKRPGRLLRMLWGYSAEFLCRIVSPKKLSEGHKPDEIFEPPRLADASGTEPVPGK